MPNLIDEELSKITDQAVMKARLVLKQLQQRANSMQASIVQQQKELDALRKECDSKKLEVAGLDEKVKKATDEIKEAQKKSEASLALIRKGLDSKEAEVTAKKQKAETLTSSQQGHLTKLKELAEKMKISLLESESASSERIKKVVSTLDSILAE